MPLQDWYCALVAGEAIRETVTLNQLSAGQAVKLGRVRGWLEASLGSENLPAIERVLAGQVVGWLGDERPGVGVRDQGVPQPCRLPEIAWCEVPAGEFLMGSDDQHQTPCSGESNF